MEEPKSVDARREQIEIKPPKLAEYISVMNTLCK